MFGMGNSGNRVHVAVTGDGTDLKQELRQADRDVDRFSKNTERNLKKTARNIGIGLTVAAGAGLRLAKEAIGRAEEMNSAYAITEQIIGQTGGAANLTAEEIKNLAREQSLLTGIDKALVTESMNVLLTFKNVRDEVGAGNDVFSKASALVLDMSAVMGTDAKSGAIQLGKALNDPIAGISALTRVGITFTDQQKDQIRAFSESGDVMSAQKIILSELESQMGGTAAASADASDKVARSFDEISESIGTKLLPLLERAAINIPHFFGQITDLQRQAMQSGLDVGSYELAGAAINKLGHDFDKFWNFGPKAGRAGSDFRDAMNVILDESDLGVVGLQQLSGSLDTLVDNFDLTEEQAEAVERAIRDRLAAALEDAYGPTEDLADATGDLDDATGDLGPTAEETANKIKDLEEAERQQAAATTAAREAIEKKQEALRQVNDPLFKLVKLNDDLAAAEKNVDEVAKSKGIASDEYRNAVMDRADLIDGINDTLRDLREDGIEPTGEAARDMLEGLKVPPGVIDEIFATFEELARDFALRELTLGVRVEERDPTPRPVPLPGEPGFFGPTIPLPGDPDFYGPMLPEPTSSTSQSITINNTFVVSEVTAARETVQRIKEEIDRMGTEVI